MRVRNVRVYPKVEAWVQKRGIEKQFKKVIGYILKGDNKSASLKLRQPKKLGIWYFRINEQYRAICEMEGTTLIIRAVDNHQ